MHESAIFPQLLDFLTVQVSEMFRDPDISADCRQVVPLLRTYPSLKIWVAGCSAGEEAYSLAILLREEGLLEQDLIYATDINPRTLAKGRAGVYDVDRIAGFTANHSIGRTAPRCRTTTRPPTADAVFDSRSKITSSSRTTASPPTRVRRGAVRLMPQRADLFRSDLQDRALGLFQGCAVPPRLSRHRLQGVDAILSLRRSVR